MRGFINIPSKLSYASPDHLIKLPKNEQGRDFAVSDVHGYFDHLTKLMNTVSFDPEKDRLFIIGDLVDRGPKSHEVANWLRRPYVHAVLGNHDNFCLNAGVYYDDLDHKVNGGDWFYLLSEDDRADIISEISKLPIAIEVKGKNGEVFGMVHADCDSGDWFGFTQLITTGRGYTQDMLEDLLISAIWSRSRIKNYDTSGVTSLDQLFVGHSSVKEVMTLRNVTFIDTGICYPEGKMTLIDINTREMWSEKR